MRFRFSIKSSTHYILFLRRLVDNICQLNNFDHKAVTALGLAVVEAVNNAIFHAHKGNSEKWIEIEICVKNKFIDAFVRDNGAGFKFPKDIDLPVGGTHGRGLFLIRSMMNDVFYTKGERLNEIKMRYFFTK